MKIPKWIRGAHTGIVERCLYPGPHGLGERLDGGLTWSRGLVGPASERGTPLVVRQQGRVCRTSGDIEEVA
jgi:hypothetical protein